MKTASLFILTRFTSLTPPPPQFLIKLICSGLLALLLVACSSGSSNSSDSGGSTTKKNQSNLIFKQFSITTTYEAGKKISNTVTGGSGTGTITYSIDNTSVATIDAATGELTIKGAGTAKIIAIKAGDANYNPIANSYILTVNVIKFEFEKPTVETKYRAGLTIQADLVIEHIVRGQVRFESNKTSVATVDNNGLLSIRGAGTATITAKRSTDRHSVRELTAMLSLTITKGDQAPLVFDKSELPVGLKKTTASNIARGGSSSGAITYSIDNTNVATVNSTNGELILKSTGTATVTATKAGDANYSTISNSYMLEVNNKLDQPELSFARDLIILDYQVGGVTTSNIAQGGTGTGAISYRSNNEDVATVDSSGVVTIKSAGTVIIRATKAGDANYNPTEASYQLMVNKIAQSGFGFTQSTITLTYLTDKTTTNIPQGGQSKGVVTYRSNNQDVATVNDEGQVTINGVGTAIITATKAEDTNYQAISSSYVLVVNKATTNRIRICQSCIQLSVCGGWYSKQYYHRRARRRGNHLPQ